MGSPGFLKSLFQINGNVDLQIMIWIKSMFCFSVHFLSCISQFASVTDAFTVLSLFVSIFFMFLIDQWHAVKADGFCSLIIASFCLKTGWLLLRCGCICRLKICLPYSSSETFCFQFGRRHWLLRKRASTRNTFLQAVRFDKVFLKISASFQYLSGQISHMLKGGSRDSRVLPHQQTVLRGKYLG